MFDRRKVSLLILIVIVMIAGTFALISLPNAAAQYGCGQANLSACGGIYQPPNYYGCPYVLSACQSFNNYNSNNYNSGNYHLHLNFNPDTDAICPPSLCVTDLWYKPGQTATFSVVPIVQVNQTMRYQFVGWSGGYSGTNTSGTLVMYSDEQLTANYETQYLLGVNAGNQTFSSWNNAGTSVPVSAPSDISTGDGARLQFVSWIEDNNTIANSSNQLSVIMDAPHSLAAQFQQQYYVSVSSQVPTPSIVGQGWYDAGKQATIFVATPPNPSYGTSYVFQAWQGNSTALNGIPEMQNVTITVNQPIQAIAAWRTDSTILYATIVAIIVVIAALGIALKLKTRPNKKPRKTAQSEEKESSASTIPRTKQKRKVAKITTNENTALTTAPITTAEELTQPSTLATKEEPKASRRFCINCGKQLPEGAKFCNKCGTTQP